MILRRIIEHVRTQNWTAIVLDFLIVVSGVFIGIQVSNLNEARIEQGREALVLERLTKDFLKIEQEAERVHEVYQEISEGSSRAIDFVNSSRDFDDVYDEEEFKQDLNLMMTGVAPIERSPTFVELLSGGQMHLIRDEAVREALVDFDSQLLRTTEVYPIFADMQMRYGEAFLPSIVFDDRLSDRPEGGYDLGVGTYDLDYMRTEPGVLSAMSMIRRAHLYNFYWQKAVVDKAHEVVGILTDSAASEE